jgi:tetratricopeptide (TPR) repeat protein
MDLNRASRLYIIREHLRSGRVAEGLSELQLLMARHADDGRVQCLYGNALMTFLEDFTAAEEAFRQALRTAPGYVELYYDYAGLLLRMDKSTEAIAILNRGMQVPGIEKDLLYRLTGRVYERESRWEDAIEQYNLALQYTFDQDRISSYISDIERVKLKLSQR